jgi:hypothetical protein
MGLSGLIKKLHDELSALPARVIEWDHRGTLLSYQTFRHHQIPRWSRSWIARPVLDR